MHSWYSVLSDTHGPRICKCMTRETCGTEKRCFSWASKTLRVQREEDANVLSSSSVGCRLFLHCIKIQVAFRVDMVYIKISPVCVCVFVGGSRDYEQRCRGAQELWGRPVVECTCLTSSMQMLGWVEECIQGRWYALKRSIFCEWHTRRKVRLGPFCAKCSSISWPSPKRETYKWDAHLLNNKQKYPPARASRIVIQLVHQWLNWLPWADYHSLRALRIRLQDEKGVSVSLKTHLSCLTNFSRISERPRLVPYMVRVTSSKCPLWVCMPTGNKDGELRKCQYQNEHICNFFLFIWKHLTIHRNVKWQQSCFGNAKNAQQTFL